MNLYEKIIWPLYNINIDPFNAFKLVGFGNKKILKSLGIEEDIKAELIVIIKKRITPKLLKIRSIFRLTCNSFDGIDNIKQALINGKKLQKNNIRIIYKIIYSPRYECIIYSFNKLDGINLMKESLNEVKNRIQIKGGTFLMEEEPLIINLKKNEF